MSFPPAMFIESPQAMTWAWASGWALGWCWEAVVEACLAAALMALGWSKVLEEDNFEIWL